MLCPGDSSPIRGALHLVGARIVDSIQDGISLLYIRPDVYRETSIELLQRAEETDWWIIYDLSFAKTDPPFHPGAESQVGPPRRHDKLLVRFYAGLAAGLDGWLGDGAAPARWQASDHHLHNRGLAMGGLGMGEDATLSPHPPAPSPTRGEGERGLK